MIDSMGSRGHPALTDAQTGMPNRLHFETVFRVMFATGLRGVPVTVILVEVEGYTEWTKTVDELEIGRVLRNLGRTLLPVVRQSDLVARLDETRFALSLLDCNMAGAVLVADRIDGFLDSIRASTGLTFSIGGATFDADMERPEDLLGAAEEAIRTAQAQGTNQMEFNR